MTRWLVWCNGVAVGLTINAFLFETSKNGWTGWSTWHVLMIAANLCLHLAHWETAL